MQTNVKKLIPAFILIAANVTVFILGFFAYDNGNWMMNSVTVYRQREYWRVFTAMFLHADIRHLVFNMISLYGLSAIVLASQPVWKYYVFYFVSGILGGFSDAGIRFIMGDWSFSLGASGAIMGLLGVCIAYFVVNRKRIPAAALKSQLLRLGIFAAINLIPGGGSVDYLAHLFGFLWGLVLGFLLIRPPKRAEYEA